MHQPRPYATTDERLAVIEEIVTEMKDTLLGNGQPGKLQQFDTRLTTLEHWRSGLGGIMMAIGSLATIGGAIAGVLAIFKVFKQ